MATLFKSEFSAVSGTPTPIDPAGERMRLKTAPIRATEVP